MSDELAAQTALEAAGAVVSPTSLKIDDPAALTWDTYQRLGEFLGALGRAYGWWVGDFLNYGEDVFGEEFAQIEASLPFRPQTLANYKSVSKHIPRSRRRPSLSFSTHAEVAYLEPPERDRWLSEAVEKDWKREHLREARRAIESGPVGDLAVSSSAAASSESRLLGDLEPGPIHTCPNCGHEFGEEREP